MRIVNLVSRINLGFYVMRHPRFKKRYKVSQDLYAVKLRSYGIDFFTELGKCLKIMNNSVKYKQMLEFKCDLLNTINC